jgi:hypothetical protein
MRGRAYEESSGCCVADLRAISIINFAEDAFKEPFEK